MTVSASSGAWRRCSVLALLATLGGIAVLLMATNAAHVSEVPLLVVAGLHEQRLTEPPLPVQPSAPHPSAAARGDAGAPPYGPCDSADSGCSADDPDAMRALPPHSTTVKDASSVATLSRAPGGDAPAGSSRPDTRPD